MSEPARASQPPPVSPCVRICRIDPASDRCEGCRRTLAEIAQWWTMDDETKRAILRDLPGRD